MFSYMIYLMGNSARAQRNRVIAFCIMTVSMVACSETYVDLPIYVFCKKHGFSTSQCACFEKELAILSEEDHQMVINYRKYLEKEWVDDIPRSTSSIYYKLGVRDSKYIVYLHKKKMIIISNTRKNCKIKPYDYFVMWNH